MADKRVGINVVLNLDSKAFSTKLEGMARDFKPINVPVKLNASENVKVQLDATALKSAFDGVGENISKVIEKSVNNLKPSGFSGLFSSITAPFQAVARGALEGVGKEVSAKFGAGLAKGIQIQTAPIIGSFDLLGEKLVTTAIPRLKNTIGGKIVGSLFDNDAVKQSASQFKQFITSTVGQADLIISQESQKAIASSKKREQLGLARRALGIQLADFVGSAPQRMQQVIGLKQQDSQLAIKQQEAQAKAQEAAAALAAKNQQLQAKQDAIIKKAAASGVTVDDNLRSQVRKTVLSDAKTAEELAKLETNNARALSALVSITGKRNAVSAKIAQLSNPVSPIVDKLDVLGISSSEIKTIGKKVELVINETKKIVSNIDNSLSQDVIKIENLQKEVGTYKQQLQNLLDDFNFQLNFAESKPEQEELLKQTVQKRAAIVAEIQQLEEQILNLTNTGKQKQQLYTGAEQKRAAKIDEARKQSNSEYQSAQARLAEKALGQKLPTVSPSAQSKSQAITTASDRIAQSKADEIYNKIVSKIANISGTQIKQVDIPRIALEAGRKQGAASYSPSTNSIALGEADYKRLQAGKVTAELVEVITHELRHALQYNFGKDKQGNSVQFLTPNEQQQAKLGNRIARSVEIGGKGKDQLAKDLLAEKEKDAYAFADKYTKEIYDFVRQVTTPGVSLKAKLTSSQKELNAAREKARQELFNSLNEENKANLEQLNQEQLRRIAKSSGLKGLSKKKVADLRSSILEGVNPEELAFKIPTFSKVNPLVQKDAQELAQLAPAQLKKQVADLSAVFRKTTVLAGRREDSQTLRYVLDQIANARSIYASALANDIEKESRQFLQSAIASLGKQRIAAQSRLQILDAAQLNSSARQGVSGASQGVSDALFSVPSSYPTPPPPPNAAQIYNRSKQRQPGQINQVNSLLGEMSAAATSAEKSAASVVNQINQQVSSQVKNVNKNLRNLANEASRIEAQQRPRSQQRSKETEESYRQARQALNQLDIETNQQVSRIEAGIKYRQQQAQQAQRQRLISYGINQTEPVSIATPAPPRNRFNAGNIVNRAKVEINDFRSQAVRKQATVLGNQAAAILVDLDSQIAIGRASAAEAKVINKQVTENEKRIQKILATVRSAREGKQPGLTSGDLQRLSGQLQQLSGQVDADRQRLAQLQPQIQKAKQLQPVQRDLQSSAGKAGQIASQRNLTPQDVTTLNQYNRQVRETLGLLGSKPPGGNFFESLNLKMPGLIKNTLSLAQGFLAFQVLNFVQTQLQQVAVEAFQTSLRFEALEKTLAFASGGAVEGAANLAFVRKEVERLSLPLEVSIKSFASLAAAARGTSLEGAQTEKIFTAIAQSARVYNLTSEQTEGALLAVQQMISKGTVNAEELRGQLGERLPGAFQIFARGMGVTTSELSKLLEQGKVGLGDLAKFATQLEKETSGGVAEATKTSAAALQKLQNQITDFNRSIGDAISPAVIVAFDGLANSLNFVQKNSKLVRAAVIGLAGAVAIIMLPSIIAVGGAIATLATVTLPLATTAMIAFVAANPFAVAALATLTIGLIAAEDGAKALANALNGVTQAQLDQADKDTSFDNKFAQGQQQLLKQVPLTKEKLDELTLGLEDQAKRGIRSAKSSQVFIDQLKRMQAQAEATAKAQDDLNKAVTNSELAFKKSKSQAEQIKFKMDLSTYQLQSKGQIGDDTLKDKEYESEKIQNINLANVYDSRIQQIKLFIKQSQDLRRAGKKGLEAKQEKELNEELLSIQKEYSQVRINLFKSEAARTKEVLERRLKDFDEAEQIQESYRKSGLVNEQQAIEALLKIRQGKAQEELNQIAEKRKKLNKTDKEGLEALAVQEAAVLARIADNRKSRFDEQFALVKGATDRATSYLEAKRKQGLTSEQQAAVQSVAIAVDSSNAQLMLIRQRLAETPKTNTAARDELLLQEQQSLAQIAEARKTAHSSFLGEVKSKEDFELAIIAAARSQGRINEQQYNEQQYNEKNRALDEQVRLIQERRGELNAADIEGQRELDKAEAETYRQRAENQKAFLESQLQQLEKSQQKAKDIVTESVKNREIEIQKLVNDRILNQEEAQAYLTQVTKDSIEEELRAEEVKFNKLQSFKYTDPAAEEERQTKIRQSRIRTSELTLQKLQNEKQQQDAVFAAMSKAYDRINQNLINGATGFIQPLERQLQLSNSLDKSFELQNKLLEARKGLYSALQSYVSADLQILQDTAKSEAEKEQLAEAAASAKLAAARLQVDIDRQSLELQIKQTESAQRRLEVENAIAQIKNRADVAQKQINLVKTQKDPNATPEQIGVAQLELQAALAEGLGLREQSTILAQERAANNQINDAKRRTQQLESGANIRKAEYEAANAIANERDKQLALKQVRDKSAMSLFGTNADDAVNRVKDYNLSNRGYVLSPLQDFFANQVRNAIAPRIPEISVPPVQANEFASNVDNFGTAVDNLINFISSKMATPTQVSINAPITNNIDSKDVRNIDVAAQFRQQFYDLGLELNRKF
jgi:tape measure domain-containing protein